MNENEWFTIPKAAKLAGVSAPTMRKWIASDLIEVAYLPSIGSGKYRHGRIRKRDIDDFINKLPKKRTDQS
tara:strand:+ start:512 stop:724 length:213 start_codon:yes stop_codon:yes gene_type:complete